MEAANFPFVGARRKSGNSTKRQNGRDADSRIVVMSNRLPFTYSRTAGGLKRQPSPGGLVSALEPTLRRRGGTWIGWPGVELKKGERISTRADTYRVAPVALSETDITRYYHGFSNRTLWPLFHSLPGHTQFVRKDWNVYADVNERFADVALRHARNAELVWIHDYHLMLTPEFMRRAHREARLAFFLHIPFPPFDIFRLCPWDKELLRGLIACDLIGFHIEYYAQNFIDCAEKILGARVDREAMIIEDGDRVAKVGVFPIGIEFDLFQEQAMRARRESQRERVVLGVDRLDYTKGIPERIRAFERLLELHPRHKGNVVLLQLAVPSRSQVAEYRDLKSEIDELVGQVNGRFATSTWSPIRYLYRSFPRDRLCGLYRDADVALVTPLRDGMNLVAKEYVACQVDDPGVLILSRMAGAAETMREALQVNPFDLDGTAEAIHRALTMDEEERASRISSLRRRERRDNVEAWVEYFLTAGSGESAHLEPISEREIQNWLRGYVKNYPLCLFLDYDGTLTPLVSHPSKAVLSTDMREVLMSCARRVDTEVSIVSGRSLDDVRKIVGEPSLIYAGNHGLEVEGPEIKRFRHEDLVHYEARAHELFEALEEIAGEGAWTEAKGPTLTFHLRKVPEARRSHYLTIARKLMTKHGYQARDAHAAVEARPPIGWDKGRAVLHILRELYGPDWSERVRVIYVGDDQTDEDAFRFLSGLAMTFRVGSADTPTAALHRLPNVEGVRRLLDWIGVRPLTEASSTHAPL
ncbi:MAG: bifunctional alpha,alpha-trehalose-phosphate synthase (UDP-forming)/trehalose-phosphatase [bacterium]|nr:bifunctional alpha,alpha-trehalose-phosphate synthase (UDP-forming)/trehalose-phosphatase [bacterium]MCP5070329.1 bifunctional alpha,alpha-trehalose-phosphate synthase (UDP-forming)/trehalose-phosphatase [bacterium]